RPHQQQGGRLQPRGGQDEAGQASLSRRSRKHRGSTVTDDTVLEATLRRDRWIVAARLAGVTVLAWIYLIVLAKAMASMGSPGGWRAFMGLMPMGRWGLL